MAPPFRSLVFLGIWKFGLWPGTGELLKLRASTCTLLRRSVVSCSGITLSPHPGWSPFWLAVAEVAAEFFRGSPPSDWKSSVSVHSECLFPTALWFWAIFGHRARNTGNTARTITAPLNTHTLSPPHPASAIVKMTYAFFSTTAKGWRHYVYIRENPRHPAAHRCTAQRWTWLCSSPSLASLESSVLTGPGALAVPAGIFGPSVHLACPLLVLLTHNCQLLNLNLILKLCVNCSNDFL